MAGSQNKQNSAAEKKLIKEITNRQMADKKLYDAQKQKEYKITKERWKRELSLDETTSKRQRDATLQLVLFFLGKIRFIKSLAKSHRSNFTIHILFLEHRRKI